MKMTRRLAVTFISRDPARRPVKYALDVPKHGSIKELRVRHPVSLTGQLHLTQALAVKLN